LAQKRKKLKALLIWQQKNKVFCIEIVSKQ
jgi:hypothetical protein